MAGADAGAVVAMKIFVEEDQIPPVRIALKEFQSPGHRAPPVRSPQENMREPAGYFRGYLPEVGFRWSMCRAFHFEVFAVVVMNFLQRLDRQLMNGKQVRPAPVGVSAE